MKTILEEYEGYLLSLIFPNSEHFCPLVGFHDSNEDAELYFKKLVLRAVLFEFSDVYRPAILSRFGLLDDNPLNYFEIQDKYNVSQDRMKQLESRILHKIQTIDFLKKYTTAKDYLLARNSSEKLKQILPYNVCIECYDFFLPISSEMFCENCNHDHKA